MNEPTTKTNFPHLHELLAAWFHQDYDIEGSTVAEVLASYRDVTPAAERALVLADVARFLESYPSANDAEFNQVFQSDIIPSVLAGSVEKFLVAIRDALDQ
jgi:hypothetical protein